MDGGGGGLYDPRYTVVHSGIQIGNEKRACISANPLIFLVPRARLELARGCPRRILSPLRLPIPPSRHIGVPGRYACTRGAKSFLSQ